MAEELKVKIVGEIPEGAERSSVRARFTRDAAEDVKGHWSKIGLAPTEEDVEGQTSRYFGLGQTEEDVEGQSYRVGYLEPVDFEENVEGHGARWNGFRPIEEEDVEGNVLKSHVLEIERDEDGELVGRYVPSGDDTEGELSKWGG